MTPFEQKKTAPHLSHGFGICRKGPVLLWTPLLEKGRTGGGKKKKKSYIRFYLPYSSPNDHFPSVHCTQTLEGLLEKTGKCFVIPNSRNLRFSREQDRFIQPNMAWRIVCIYVYIHTKI